MHVGVSVNNCVFVLFLERNTVNPPLTQCALRQRMYGVYYQCGELFGFLHHLWEMFPSGYSFHSENFLH